MDLAFREFRTYPVFSANQVIGTVPVKEGSTGQVQVTPAKPLMVTMQVDSHAGLKTQLKADPNLTAPIGQGQRVGVVMITAPDFPALTVPVFAAQAEARANIFSRLWGRAFGHK